MLSRSIVFRIERNYGVCHLNMTSRRLYLVSNRFNPDTHGQTDGQTQMDKLWYEINVPFFLQEKAGIKCIFY